MPAAPIPCPCCGKAIVDDGRVLVDFDAGLVVGTGKIASLTGQEFALFSALWVARPKTFSKDQLLRATCADVTGNDDRDLKIVDVFVCKIRKKLDPLGITIATVWGTGYRIELGERTTA